MGSNFIEILPVAFIILIAIFIVVNRTNIQDLQGYHSMLLPRIKRDLYPHHIKRYKKEHNIKSIPKVCHQTWNDTNLSEKIIQIRKRNQEINPEVEFVLYTSEGRDKFIKENFDERTYKAFKTINPKYGVAVANFFRYCVLYIKGGVYLDIKSSITVDIFKKVIKPEDICILDIPRTSFQPYRKHTLYPSREQWLLIFSAGHPYLKYMIDRTVRIIESRIIPYQLRDDHNFSKELAFRLTGTDSFAVAIHEAVIDIGVLHRDVDYFTIARRYTGWDDKSQYRHSGVKHYSELRAENIYV